MKIDKEQPLTTRRFISLLTATAAAALLFTVHHAHAQIEVDVGTTAPGSAATVTTSTESADQSEPSATSVLQQDAAADQAAQKIVPAPGTQMQSTEDGTLGTAGVTVAAEPSLRMQEDAMVLQDGVTTETLAVESGAELLRLLGVQLRKQSAAGPSELDESTTNTLFDVTAIRRLKGSDPTVVYRVVVEDTPMPDPMIVPWIRQAKLLQERFDRAVQLLGDNRVEAGRQELLGIVTDFPDTDYAVQARALLRKLDELNQPIAIPTAAVEEEREQPVVVVELSPNVTIGTVVVDPQDPANNRAMIAGRAYKVGDPISGIPNHKVVGITDSMVQIEVEQSEVTKIFDVPVRPRGATE